MATAVESHPASSFNAPSPFITAKGNAFDHLLPGYKVVEGQGYALYQQEIIKSPNDDRTYRLILLPNGMEALIIHDATTDKSSASVDVKVGHLHDPEDLPGLAHFCEHLMFMGTEKYPKENDYTEFLTKNSGSSNAFTGMDQTCYYFDVHPTAFLPALDRFAQFFISPLFDPSCTEREANAVHSENSKNLQSDMWRMYQLDKSTSSRDHEYWRFGTGNKETLWDNPVSKGEDVRARLMSWQEKYYSANLMKLVVLSKDSLEETTKVVVEKFSAALNRNLPVPDFPGSPLGPKELKTAIYVKSVKDQRSLEISFPFPDESAYYATKPGSFLSHLIGHEGQGSVLSYLKKKGWANSISAGAGNGAIGFEFFRINADLTKEGLEHHQDVTEAIFQYISLLQSTPPQEWAFDEQSTLSKLGFRFKEKSPPTQTAMSLSLQMSKPYPRDLLLSAPWLYSNWNEDLVTGLASRLRRDNCRIMIASQGEIEGKTYENKEEWYGTEYTIVPLAESLLKGKSSDEFKELVLPAPNSFIPSDIEIKEKVEVTQFAKKPLSLRNTPISRVWYKKDDRWWVPRAGAFFLLRSPLIDSSPLNSVQSRLFTELIRDSLVEYSYEAELAGLSYTFDSQADGILLTIDGYNDKLGVLAKVVFEKMRTLQVDRKRFDIVMDQLRRAFVNYRLEQPYNHAAFGILHLTQETLWTQEERLAQLDNVTVESLQAYIASMLERMHIETLVHGNILKNEALDLATLAETTLAPAPLTAAELKTHRALTVPEGTFLTREIVSNPENANCAVEQFTYIGDVADDQIRNKLSVLATMVSEPMFDQLRSKEQLGYIVSSGARKSIGFAGLRVIVQSERSAEHIESRINNFWEGFKDTLAKMTDEDFDKYKSAVINKKLEDHKNMWQESSHLWVNIHAGYYDFLQEETDAEIIKNLTKASVVDFFNLHFFNSPTHAIRRITSHQQSQCLEPASLLLLAPLLGTVKLPVDQTALQQFASTNPTLAGLKTWSNTYLLEAGNSQKTVDAYLKKVDELLGGEYKVPEGFTLIENRNEFRSQRTPGPYAVPVAEYSALFPASAAKI